jgi:formylglycine-generating enzyme required for sulfatase activity
MIRLRSVIAAASIAAITAIVACGADDSAAAPNPNGKAEGAVCTDGSECQSLTCKAGKCTPVTGSNPTDKVRNGDETDVDCGGASAPACSDGKACKVATDCESAICKTNVCKAPAPDDGAKNGDESDVDCGGTKAPRCAVDKACTKNEDCASDGCSYQKKCVVSPSCTGHFGGDTCGAGDTGSGTTKHESCCTKVTAGSTTIGKYYVTAGRMRAFVDHYQGNLQSWVSLAQPQGWNSAWTAKLPSTMAEAMSALGPNEKRGCYIKGQGGRTFWQPPMDGDPEEHNDFSKDVLDEKALNCVSWYMAQAICAFDGGRLASAAEVNAQITNNGTTKYPWGATPVFQAKKQLEQLVHFYSYQTPNPPADMRTVGSDPLDKAFFIAPPGRRPLGNNKAGVADPGGLVLPWVNDGALKFSWTASWEGHSMAGTGQTANPSQWPPADSDGSENDGYYSIGVRCAYDK